MSFIVINDQTADHSNTVERGEHLMKVIAVMAGEHVPGSDTQEMQNAIQAYLPDAIADLLAVTYEMGLNKDWILQKALQLFNDNYS
jgi:hypothetical protein